MNDAEQKLKSIKRQLIKMAGRLKACRYEHLDTGKNRSINERRLGKIRGQIIVVQKQLDDLNLFQMRNGHVVLMIFLLPQCRLEFQP